MLLNFYWQKNVKERLFINNIRIILHFVCFTSSQVYQMQVTPEWTLDPLAIITRVCGDH